MNFLRSFALEVSLVLSEVASLDCGFVVCDLVDHRDLKREGQVSKEALPPCTTAVG